MAFTPTDPLKAEVRVVGTAPNQQLDFYIPRGPKGDPGGITLGTALDNAIDTGVGRYNLNDVLVSGVYRMTATNDNLLVRNYPRNYDTGILVVLERVPGQTVTQVWHTINQTGRIVYERTYVTGTWTPWRAFNSTRVDQTAGRVIYQFDDVNGREQLIYGDTGRRNISTSIPTAVSGSVILSRQNNLVMLILADFLDSSPNTNVNWNGIIPVGFRPSNWLYMPLVSNRSMTIQNGGNVTCVSGGLTPNTVVYQGCLTWRTEEAWPTTLPGTAVGSIPNI